MIKTIIIGRLGQNPEQKTTKTGETYARLSIASDGHKKKDGTKEDPTWVSVFAFGKRSELALAYLQKGSTVYVECSMKVQKKDDGKNEYIFTAEEITFLSGGKPKALDVAIATVNAQNATQEAPNSPNSTNYQAPITNAFNAQSVDDYDDIPF